MDLYGYIEEAILAIVGKSTPNITVEPTRNPKHGDIATNAPIILSKLQGKSVGDIGQEMLKRIQELPEVSHVELAKAGFLNITIKNNVWHDIVREINKKGIGYGDLNLGQGEVVHIESVSANPTGPLHIGHARAAVFLGALGKLLEKVGYKVAREYYVNDSGAQIEALTESVISRYKEALEIESSESVTYPGEYLKHIGKDLAEKYGDSLLANLAENTPIMRDFTIEKIMSSIKEDLKLLGIEHDIFVSEASLYNTIQEAVDLLAQKGLIYKGELSDPKGKKSDNWQAHSHLLFRSTEFGDESDRSLQKSDGAWTYFAADIAYHLDKIKRGFKNMVLGLGVDHAGYVNRIKAAVAALSDNTVTMNVKLYNIVHLFENGVAVKMSKRSGKFLTVRELIEEVGDDVVKYMMLTRRHDVVLDLDLQQVKEHSKDNPIFYVQYAHARACSVLRQIVFNITGDHLSLLSTDTELSLIKLLAKWPRIVRNVARTYEVHRIAGYLQEVSEAFHALWHCGNQNTLFKFIVPDNNELTQARLALVKAVKNTLASGLDVLSIQAKNVM